MGEIALTLSNMSTPKPSPLSIDFREAWDHGDITFIVEGQRLYASKAILSIWSPVMKTMFTANFVEKDAEEINLPEKKFNTFHKFIKMLHPPNEDFEWSSIKDVLSLAREYQVDHLLIKAEEFLKQRPSVFTLHIAEVFNLDSIKEHCYKKINTIKFEYLQSEPGFEELSLEAKCKIYREKAAKYERIVYSTKDILCDNEHDKHGFSVRHKTCDDKTLPSTTKHVLGSDKTCRNCALKISKRIARVQSILP